jgi:hypothetical protein
VLLPNRFRVRGPLSNMTEFADAFKCPANSPMRAQKACAVWWSSRLQPDDIVLLGMGAHHRRSRRQ